MSEKERLELVSGNEAITALLRRIALLNQVIKQMESLPISQKQNDGWNQIPEKCQDAEKKIQEQQLQIEKQQADIAAKNDIIKEQRAAIERIERLTGEYQEQAVKLQNELAEYTENYRAINQAQKQYESLSQDIKDRLRNIFQNGSVYGLITACAAWESIKGLWEFTKRRIVEGEEEDVENLIGILHFLLDGFNAKESIPKYEWIQPVPGEKFDSDHHTILGIQTDGFVSGLKLPGIKEAKSKKVLCKALVTVGEEKS